MTFRKFSVNKIASITFFLATTGVASFILLNTYIHEQKQGDGKGTEPYRAALSGEYICLPHTKNSGPQTTECAFGLKTDVGEYFAIDFTLMSQEAHELSVGQKLTANGLVTPVERLSSDHWKQYPIEGIFSFTDSVIVE